MCKNNIFIDLKVKSGQQFLDRIIQKQPPWPAQDRTIPALWWVANGQKLRTKKPGLGFSWGVKNTFAKAEGGQYTKLAMRGHIPRFAKKIVCKKFVFAEKKGPHLTEKCIEVLNVSCSLWVMIFFYRHNTQSVTEFPVFNIKCKTKLFCRTFLMLAFISIDLIMFVQG